uniref:Amino acid transporter n=1 Tax=Myotis lucifugus TaxID=59463 RepID=G1PLS2_MYOLU
LGIGIGVLVREYSKLSNLEKFYFAFPGEILMRMLKLIILPLIVSSMITGVAALDSNVSGKIGLRAVAYYFCTTLIAVILAMVFFIKVSTGVSRIPAPPSAVTPHPLSSSIDSLVDRCMFVVHNLYLYLFLYSKPSKLRFLAPYPPFLSCFFVSASFMLSWFVFLKWLYAAAVSGVYLRRHLRFLPSPFIFILFFKLCFKILTQGYFSIDFFFREGMDGMKVVVIILAAVVVEAIAAAADVAEVPERDLFKYLAKFTWLPLLNSRPFFCTKCIHWQKGAVRNERLYLGQESAISQVSALKGICQRCQESYDVEKRTKYRLLRMGHKVSIALYMRARTVVFSALKDHTPLSLPQPFSYSVTATAASIGAAGVPQAGLVTMVIVLSAVGLPTEDVTLIIAVDWFLDRFRTMVNVLGDAFGTGIVEKLSKKELEQMSVASDVNFTNPFAVETTTLDNEDSDAKKSYVNGGFAIDRSDTVSFTQTSQF